MLTIERHVIDRADRVRGTIYLFLPDGTRVTIKTFKAKSQMPDRVTVGIDAPMSVRIVRAETVDPTPTRTGADQ